MYYKCMLHSEELLHIIYSTDNLIFIDLLILIHYFILIVTLLYATLSIY